MKYVYKKAEFDANFESVEKAKKISCAKKLSMKKWQKSFLLLQYYCLQKFTAYIAIFWGDFLHFSTYSISASVVWYT